MYIMKRQREQNNGKYNCEYLLMSERSDMTNN